jgi:hypothetical protein
VARKLDDLRAKLDSPPPPTEVQQRRQRQKRTAARSMPEASLSNSLASLRPLGEALDSAVSSTRGQNKPRRLACAQCSEVKAGRADEDGTFYCDKCWALYNDSASATVSASSQAPSQRPVPISAGSPATSQRTAARASDPQTPSQRTTTASAVSKAPSRRTTATSSQAPSQRAAASSPVVGSRAPSQNIAVRREGFGECGECESYGSGELDENGTLYCHACWEAYDRMTTTATDEGVLDETMAAGLRIRADGILVAGQARLRTDALPVDDHEGAILESVARHRVTIIQGGTGSGKSSRVPYMLMRAASRGKNGPKLMVAQPRRVAARALYQRALAEGHKDIVGMRMGHGVREGEPSARVWFVTTGYLVQLVSGFPDQFARHSQ